VTGALYVMPVARAQDGDLPYNDPQIISLAEGQTVTRGFSVLAGDSFELKLNRLAEFTYAAALIDPGGSTTPLTPDATGNATFQIEGAALGGVYQLTLQATAGSGELLIQLNSTSAAPEPLGLGESSTIEVTDSTARYLLEPPADGPVTTLMIDLTGEGETVPAFTLVDPETGEVVLSVAGGVFPSFAITLPAGEAYVLSIEPGEEPVLATVQWSEAIPAEEPTPDTASAPAGAPGDSSAPPGDSSGSSGSGPSSSSSGACQVVIGGTGVNVRSGPGLNFNPPIGQATPGTIWTVTGRSTDNAWWQINFNNTVGWVSAQISAVQAQGNCANVPIASSGPPSSGGPPVSGGSPTPTPTASVTPGGPTATFTSTFTPSPTYTPGGPTLTPTFTPSFTPTASPTLNVTATFTPSYTPTTQLQQPTATFTPSYTPTTPPAAQEAPPDANFNAPLNIPLDSTASVTDFVSFPGGDTQDRVRWDISGMNPNSALSGGRARLTLAVSCFGTGLENITFFTGGSSFGCGQTIVDREVTADSRTGQVTISAVGGEGTYVQWVLTGTAVRVN
jgi:uncharacterized protein YraI